MKPKYVKARDPIEGEFLPYERKSRLLMPEYDTSTSNGRCQTAPAMGTRNIPKRVNPQDKVNAQYEKCLVGIGQVNALRQRKKDLQMEMEHINRIMEHKKVCLAAGAYGGYGKLLETLHPALQQVTATDY